MNDRNEEALPAAASVVVIGGGVMGCSTLYHLAALGITDAVLLERNSLTSGTTWHSAAQVRALRSTRNLTDLIRYSIGLYGRLEEETGQATGWINKGSLSIATSQDRLTHVKRQEALSRLFGLQARSIAPREAKERWPLMKADDVIGAVWSPEDGRVSPSDLCAALVKGARSRGARIFEQTAVLGIETRDRRVVGLRTTRGDLRCDAIAICCGLWSRRVAALAGVGVPLTACEHFYLLTRAVPGIEGNLPTLSDHDAGLYIRDEAQGLLVGCFEPLGKPLDPAALGEDFAFQLLPEDWDHFEPMMLAALNRVPALETAEVRMLLNGPESFTFDGSFLLGEAAETRGCFLGCGMNSVGVASGGGAGMALAHAIVEGHMPVDLHEADPKRFPDCVNDLALLAERAPEVLGKHYEISYPGRAYASARNLRRLPLQSLWSEAKAWTGQVYGWERPLFFGCEHAPALRFGRPDWFEAVGREVQAAHQGAAVFDLSTFGKIRVQGPDAEVFLNRVCANNMRRPPGRAIYTAMLTERGGFQSDLTALRLGSEDYRLTVGTGSIRRDLAWLERHRGAEERVAIEDETEALAVLGVMGPEAQAILTGLGGGALADLGYFRHAEAELAGVAVRAARLSYVGEAGFEIACSSGDAPALCHALLERGALPAGLYAQTAMRIEKRYLSLGHDLDEDVTPLEAGLDFALAWDSDFLGREALLRRRERPVERRMTTLVLEDPAAVPLGGEPVLLGRERVGQTTSAAFGYRVGRPVALAYLPAALAAGARVSLDIAGELFAATAQRAAAFDPLGERMRSRV